MNRLATLGFAALISLALATQASQSAGAAKLGHVNNYNHMTSVYAIGEGASGPPPHREPA